MQNCMVNIIIYWPFTCWNIHTTLLKSCQEHLLVIVSTHECFRSLSFPNLMDLRWRLALWSLAGTPVFQLPVLQRGRVWVYRKRQLVTLTFCFCYCGDAEKLLRPAKAIIPFPLYVSNLSAAFCYPALIASSPVNTFILSPLCLGSNSLPSSDSIKNHNFGSCSADQIGQLMHFSCFLNFFSQCTSYLHIDWVFISVQFKADSV